MYFFYLQCLYRVEKHKCYLTRSVIFSVETHLSFIQITSWLYWQMLLVYNVNRAEMNHFKWTLLLWTVKLTHKAISLARESVLTNGNNVDALRAISGMRHCKSSKSKHTFVCMYVWMALIGSLYKQEGLRYTQVLLLQTNATPGCNMQSEGLDSISMHTAGLPAALNSADIQTGKQN
jgi:hypothetical protein